MIKRHVPGRNAIAAVVVAAILAATVAAAPVTADHGKGRGREQKVKHKIVQRNRNHREDDRQQHRDRHDYRNPAVHVHRGPSPRIEHHHAVWALRPARITYWEQRPFYLHSGFNVFFGGDAFWFEVGNAPPPGYYYFDPYCQCTFTTVWDYRVHLRRHRHSALIDVVVADGPHPDHYVHAHDGCGH